MMQAFVLGALSVSAADGLEEGWCTESQEQLCRAKCPPNPCESADQCALRDGKCCKYTCVDTPSDTTVAEMDAPKPLFDHKPSSEELLNTAGEWVGSEPSQSMLEWTQELTGMDMDQLREYGEDFLIEMLEHADTATFLSMVEESLEFRLLGDGDYTEDAVKEMDANPEDAPTRRLALKESMNKLRNLHEGVHHVRDERRRIAWGIAWPIAWVVLALGGAGAVGGGGIGIASLFH